MLPPLLNVTEVETPALILLKMLFATTAPALINAAYSAMLGGNVAVATIAVRSINKLNPLSPVPIFSILISIHQPQVRHLDEEVLLPISYHRSSLRAWNYMCGCSATLT